jgi:hypothetical protein
VPNPTWHRVLADDLVWLLGLTRPRVHRVTSQQLRGIFGLGARALDIVLAAVTQALAGRGHLTRLTRPQLARELTERGIVSLRRSS